MVKRKKAWDIFISSVTLERLRKDRKRLKFIFENTICYQYVTLPNGEYKEVDIRSRKDVDFVMENQP